MHRLTWCTSFCCLTTLKLCLGQNSTKSKIRIWGFARIVVCCFRPHLNLPKQLVYLCFTLLPCLITFNIVGYITERELNNWCGVSSTCNSLHMELHLICSVVCCILPCHASLNRTCIILVCASCHVYACAFTMLFVSFWCCFLVPVMLRL